MKVRRKSRNNLSQPSDKNDKISRLNISQVKMAELELSVEEGDAVPEQLSNRVANAVTSPYLTDYEYVELLASRTLQLFQPSHSPKIANTEGMTPMEIAKEEIRQRVIPLVISRELPNGTQEIWKIPDMNIV